MKSKKPLRGNSRQNKHKNPAGEVLIRITKKLKHRLLTSLTTPFPPLSINRFRVTGILLRQKHPLIAARVVLPGLFIGIVGSIGLVYVMNRHPYPVQALSNSANVFVSPNGSDSGVNCKRFASVTTDPDSTGASLCKTFQKAYQVANSSDTIEVEAGTYIGPEYVYPNAAITSKVIFRPAASAAINITDASGHGQPVFIKASHVEFDDFPFGYQEFAGTGACGWSCPSHTYGLQIQPPSGANGSYQCISDIVIKNATGHSFSVNNGVSNVSFIGGSWGNLGWQPGQTSDLAASWNAPAIGGSASFKCPDSATTGSAATNITFDGVHFGNNFQGCENAAVYGANPQSTCVEPTHPDCMHIFGETVGLHIENSWFDHCMGFYMNLNAENNYVVDGQARMKDALFENNIFGDDNAGGYDSWNQIAPAGTGPLYMVCDNVTFRNNTFGHDQSPNPLFAINCPLAAGATKGVQFYNNIFTDWATSACPSTATFDHNLFVTGPTCGTNVYTGGAGFVKPTDNTDSTFSWAATPWTADFHINSVSAAIGKGIAASCPGTDFDGVARPAGTPCDLGALQYQPLPEVWVSTTGNDTTCVRGDQTKPCATFNKAYQLAGCGDEVEVESGSYVAQTIVYQAAKDTCTSASRVEFTPAPPASVIVAAFNLGTNGPKHLKISDMTSSDISTIGPGSDDIYIDNLTAKSFNIFGASNITVKGGNFGNCASDATHNCVFKIGDGYAAGNIETNPSNIVIDGATIHDMTTTDPVLYHIECMYIVAGGPITIKNSTFYHCQDFDIFGQDYNSAIAGNTTPHDVSIQNNLFGEGYDDSVFTSPRGTAVSITSRGQAYSNWNISFNSFYEGTVISGKSSAAGFGFSNSCPGADCGGTMTGGIALGNLMANGCSSGFTYSYNLTRAFSPFTNTAACSATDTVQAYDAGNFGYTNPADLPTGDWHLSEASVARNRVPAASCPATDINGKTRNISDGFCDAGADEFTVAGAPSPPPIVPPASPPTSPLTPPASALLKGDCNNDGHVTLTDLSILLSHYGTNYSKADFDSNGIVSLTDLSILLSHYGE
jgi:hypothetical protein